MTSLLTRIALAAVVLLISAAIGLTHGDGE